MNTKSVLSAVTFGLLASELPAGFTNQKRAMTPKRLHPAKWPKVKMSLFSLFCILISFASKKQFAVASHNLHGYKKSSVFL